MKYKKTFRSKKRLVTIKIFFEFFIKCTSSVHEKKFFLNLYLKYKKFKNIKILKPLANITF